MKVSIIVQGRFHAFEMASYFQEKGILNELVTGYPKSFAKKFGIHPKFVKSIYINEIINRTTYYLLKSHPLDFWATELFDIITSRVVKLDSDIYFIWSGCALRTIKSIRKKNPSSKIILVRGSAHIAQQEELLRLVNKSKGDIINKRMVQKELAEYSESDYITVPSTFALESFIKYNIPNSKLFLNFLGVDLKQFPFVKREITKDEPLKVGYVGSISAQKNVLGLINVIKSLFIEGYPLKLILVGAIDKSSFDKTKIFENNSFIDYYPPQPQNKLINYYALMDVFILNTIQDGFAMVLLQAMSSGLPIIATSNSGGPDIIKDGINGFVIPPFDENVLKEKILWCLNNKDQLQEMGKISKNISEQAFTWDDFGKRNIEFMDKIMHN